MNTQQFEILETLKGKKATIFKFSEMGFPQSIQCEITDVYIKNYAQYDNCFHVNYKPKGKRSIYVWRLFYYQSFAVFAGHVVLNADMFASSKTENGITIRESFTCFSENYLTRALSSTTQKPLLIQDKEKETA